MTPAIIIAAAEPRGRPDELTAGDLFKFRPYPADIDFATWYPWLLLKILLILKVVYQMVMAVFVQTLLVPVKSEPTGRQFGTGIRYSRGEI